MAVFHEKRVVEQRNGKVGAGSDEEPYDLAFPLAASGTSLSWVELSAVNEDNADRRKQENAQGVDQVDPRVVVLVGRWEQVTVGWELSCGIGIDSRLESGCLKVGMGSKKIGEGVDFGPVLVTWKSLD